MYYFMNLTLFILRPALIMKSESSYGAKKQIELSFTSVNINVQTTIKMSNGYIFWAYLEFVRKLLSF